MSHRPLPQDRQRPSHHQPRRHESPNHAFVLFLYTRRTSIPVEPHFPFGTNEADSHFLFQDFRETGLQMHRTMTVQNKVSDRVSAATFLPMNLGMELGPVFYRRDFVAVGTNYFHRPPNRSLIRSRKPPRLAPRSMKRAHCCSADSERRRSLARCFIRSRMRSSSPLSSQ